MFIEITILSIILGYLSGGTLNNLDSSKIKGLYIILVAFSIELSLNLLIKSHFIVRGNITFVLDLIMYCLIFMFGFLNKKNIYINVMIVGFLLNALPIFLNGGAMPVSPKAVVYAGLVPSIDAVKVSSEGLYTLQNNFTKLWFLGDIIPKPALKPFLRAAVISIGDIISGIGLMLFMISGMRKK